MNLTFDWSKIEWIRLLGPAPTRRFIFLALQYKDVPGCWSGSHVAEVLPDGWLIITRDQGGGVEAMLSPDEAKTWVQQAMEHCVASLWHCNPKAIEAVGISRNQAAETAMEEYVGGAQ